MFRTDIQGLRAVAVGAVVAYHVGLPFAAGGYVGVDVFFVISGFLISGHLIREFDATGRIRFADFYARRARRILPAAFTVIVATVLAISILLPFPRVLDLMRDALASLLLVPNVWFAVQSTDYLSPTAASPFQHYWSLGVEEQFYLFWPALLLLVLLVRRLLPVALVVITLLSFGLGAWLITVSVPWTFFSLPTRAWEFALGALVAVVLARNPEWGIGRAPWVRPVLGWLGLAAILGSAVLFSAATPFPGVWAAIPVAGTALVILAGGSPVRGGPGGVLGLAPLQVIGLISYSIYLVHWPALNLTAAVLGSRMSIRIGLLVAVLTIGVAWLLYRFVERPFLRRRSWPNRRTLAATAVATAAGLAVIAGAVGVAYARPGDAGIEAAESPGTATPYVPVDLRPSLDDASGDLPSIYTDDCHSRLTGSDWKDCRFGDPGAPTSVVLFGDSHAANWFPALAAAAEAGDFRLRTFTKSACSAAQTMTFLKGNVYQDCLDWRASVFAELKREPPDLVILSGSAVNTPLDGWESGIRAAVSELVTASNVVYIADGPRFGQPVPECLAAHLTDALVCARTPGRVVPAKANARAEAATTSAGGTFVDLTDEICPGNLCAGIRGDILVFRDDAHLTATFSATLAPVLARLVDENTPRTGDLG